MQNPGNRAASQVLGPIFEAISRCELTRSDNASFGESPAFYSPNMYEDDVTVVSQEDRVPISVLRIAILAEKNCAPCHHTILPQDTPLGGALKVSRMLCARQVMTLAQPRLHGCSGPAVRYTRRGPHVDPMITRVSLESAGCKDAETNVLAMFTQKTLQRNASDETPHQPMLDLLKDCRARVTGALTMNAWRIVMYVTRRHTRVHAWAIPSHVLAECFESDI